MSDLGMTRRSFLGTSALAGTALTIIPRSVLAAPGRPGANDRINHAIIGVGGMGNSHIGYVLKDPQAKLVAVCDVRKSRRDAAVQRAGADCHPYLDFREMLDRESIDFVHVVTPPHWHALQNIAALNAGCDVWAEKPMTRTIAEYARCYAVVAMAACFGLIPGFGFMAASTGWARLSRR